MSNLINILIREAIGYDSLTKFVEPAKVNNYPPHNIVKLGDDKYNLILAVAGFNRQELEVTVEDGHLHIAGKRNRDSDPETVTELLYQGLAFRDFTRAWRLGEYVEVTGVTLEDGILTVMLEKQVPDAKKARTIDIK